MTITNLPDKSVRIEVNRSDGSVLAPGQHHVVGHADEAVDSVGVTGVLVAVVPIFALK